MTDEAQVRPLSAYPVGSRWRRPSGVLCEVVRTNGSGDRPIVVRDITPEDEWHLTAGATWTRIDEPAPEPVSEAPAFDERRWQAAKGKAYLLKLSDGGEPEQFRTVAGLRRQDPQEPDLFVGTGVFTGDQARLQVQAIALRGSLERVELSFEDGERIRGRAAVREVQFIGEQNGEATFRVALFMDTADALVAAMQEPQR